MTEESNSIWFVAVGAPVCFSDCIGYTVELDVHVFVVLCF